jgi:hypothetical protein
MASAILKFAAYFPTAPVRASFLVDAQQAMATLNRDPGREATVLEEDIEGHLWIRGKALLLTNQEARRGWNLLGDAMTNRGATSDPTGRVSWSRVTSTAGVRDRYQEWP